MDREDLENELKAQLQASTNSNQFPSTRLTSLIQNAYRMVTNLWTWKALTKAVKTDTKPKAEGADECYYDYPSEFRTGTIYKLMIDGKNYDRKSYDSFMKFRENYPNSQEKIFALHQRYIFVSPDTTEGDNNMHIYGAFEAPELSLPESTTIFSNNAEHANLALVSVALATALKKSAPKLAGSEMSGAIATFTKLNSDEWEQYSLDQPIDIPLLDVPDFFGGFDNSNLIGRFVGFRPL